MSAMKILIATGNPHKLDEIRALWPCDTTLLGLDTWPQTIAEPIEDQPTFEGNALLKARYYARATGQWCLADDSGLEVDALDGAPGVLSARYSGASGPRAQIDAANNRRLLNELQGVALDKRTARFVCAMALCEPLEDPTQPPLALVRGTVEGRILMGHECEDPVHPHRGRGGNGFGYDPLFFYPPANCTTAELAPQAKNAISHRGAAVRALLKALRLG